MILVVPAGADARSRYSHELASRLPDIGVLQTETFGPDGHARWGAGLVRSSWQGLRFARQLQRLREPIHLPAGDLARYGLHLDVPYLVTVHDEDEDALSGRDARGLRNAGAVFTFNASVADALVRDLKVREDRVYVLDDKPGAWQTHRVYEAIEAGFYQSTVNRASDAGFRVAVGSH